MEVDSETGIKTALPEVAQQPLPLTLARRTINWITEKYLYRVVRQVFKECKSLGKDQLMPLLAAIIGVWLLSHFTKINGAEAHSDYIFALATGGAGAVIYLVIQTIRAPFVIDREQRADIERLHHELEARPERIIEVAPIKEPAPQPNIVFAGLVSRCFIAQAEIIGDWRLADWSVPAAQNAVLARFENTGLDDTVVGTAKKVAASISLTNAKGVSWQANPAAWIEHRASFGSAEFEAGAARELIVAMWDEIEQPKLPPTTERHKPEDLEPTMGFVGIQDRPTADYPLTFNYGFPMWGRVKASVELVIDGRVKRWTFELHPGNRVSGPSAQFISGDKKL